MHKLNFTWLTNHSCNYRCPYCFLDGRWDEFKRSDKHFSKKEIIAAWKRIRDSYSESHICISGGEPTIYPEFIDIVKEISQMHTVGISTNLSLDVSKITENLNPSRVDLSISFHPHFTKVEAMLEKLNVLKKFNWPMLVMCVGWPPLIPLLDDFYAHFKEFNFSVLPFWGTYDAKTYPQGYTSYEKEVVNRYIARRENEDFKTEPVLVRGRLCRAGQVYAHIEPDGRVLRCSAGAQPLARKFYDKNFSLLNEPSACNAEFCHCLEYVVCE